MDAHVGVGRTRRRKQIMIYTYNIGNYDSMRTTHVMQVPLDADAYFFVERSTDDIASSRSSVLEAWRLHGWNIVELSMQPATPYLTSTRFTSKVLKFAPPIELFEGRKWVVSFDADIYIRLHDLPAFLQRRQQQAPLMMVDWRHWPGNYSMTGFECMEQEMNSMLEGPMKDYVTSSRPRCLKWRTMMRQLHAVSGPAGVRA